MDLDRITSPMRLARGSHLPGSGKGCAMNVISYINGDEHITDFPATSARPLASFVQLCNDLLAESDGYLSPENSLLVLDLGWLTVGTGTTAQSENTRLTAGSAIKKKLDTVFDVALSPMQWIAARTVSAVVVAAPPTNPSASPARTIAAPKYIGFSSRFAASTSVTPRDFQSGSSNRTYRSTKDCVAGSIISRCVRLTPASRALASTAAGAPTSMGFAIRILTRRSAARSTRASVASGYTIRFGLLAARVRNCVSRSDIGLYFVVGTLVGRSRFLLISMPWRLIFWLSVDRGILKLSAASV